MTSRTVVHGFGTSRAPATQDVVKFSGDSTKALNQDHGERARGGQTNNACPACGVFSRERGDWVRWNGQMR